MNILLIGHEGYLGRGLTAFFAPRHRVIGWDKSEDLFKLDASALKGHGIEAVINLAVAADRQSKVFLPDEATDVVNVGGARHLARLLKGTDLPWIQISTREVFGAVYGKKDVVKTKEGYAPKFLVDETEPWEPPTFYGKSKVMVEMIAESHPRSVIIRLTTCYTDFDHPAGNWVVSLVKKAVRGEPVPLTNGGLQFRDPLHTDDLGRLIELSIEKRLGREVLHAGGGRKNLITLKEFVRRANPDVKIDKRPGGDLGFAFDNTKATKLTGWKPQVLVRERIPVIAENMRRGNSGAAAWSPSHPAATAR